MATATDGAAPTSSTVRGPAPRPRIRNWPRRGNCGRGRVSAHAWGARAAGAGGDLSNSIITAQMHLTRILGNFAHSCSAFGPRALVHRAGACVLGVRGSEYSVLVVERERRSRIESRWRGERGVGP